MRLSFWNANVSTPKRMTGAAGVSRVAARIRASGPVRCCVSGATTSADASGIAAILLRIPMSRARGPPRTPGPAPLRAGLRTAESGEVIGRGGVGSPSPHRAHVDHRAVPGAAALHPLLPDLGP